MFLTAKYHILLFEMVDQMKKSGLMHSLSFLFQWQDLAINKIQIRNKIVSTQLKTLAKVQIIVASNVLHQFEVEVIPRSKKPSCLCVATYSNSQCTLFCTCLRLRSPPLHTLPDRTRHTCGIHFVPRQHRSNRGCVIFFLWCLFLR